MTLFLFIFCLMKDELILGLRTLALWRGSRMCPSPIWAAPSKLFLCIHVQGDWWCRCLWSHSGFQSFVSFTLLVVVFHVLQVHERSLGTNGVALASRIIIQLGGCAREDVRFPVLCERLATVRRWHKHSTKETFPENYRHSDLGRNTFFCSVASFRYASTVASWSSGFGILKSVIRLIGMMERLS
jgi:hypothetical protein